MGDSSPDVIAYLGAWVFGMMLMIIVAYYLMRLLYLRFAWGKARVLAIGFTAAIALPILVPGAIWHGIALFAANMALLLTAAPRDPDEPR